MFTTTTLVPHKMAVSTQKLQIFQYIIQSYTHRGKRSYTGGAGQALTRYASIIMDIEKHKELCWNNRQKIFRPVRIIGQPQSSIPTWGLKLLFSFYQFSHLLWLQKGCFTFTELLATCSDHLQKIIFLFLSCFSTIGNERFCLCKKHNLRIMC